MSEPDNVGASASAPMEQRLTEIWAEALEVPDIRPDDSFLDLGGESISAALCASRVRKVFGIDVPLALLLGHGMTIGKLARFIEETRPTA